MNAALYHAAADGAFKMFEHYAQPPNSLMLILSKNQNTILHVHLKSRCKRSKEFVETVLGKCPQLLLQTNNNDDTPLHFAAKYGHEDIVQVLIEEAKKPIHRHLEIREEEADSIRRMLRKTNKQKETALHLAIRDCCLDVVKELLKHEDRNFSYTANVSGESPLYLALYQQESDIAKEILNKFETPDCGGPNGRTAFHAAVCRDFIEDYDGLFDLLLSKVGSFVNQADDSGWTPLHYVAYFNYADQTPVCKILGKDIHSAYATEKERNRTALHIASCRGNRAIMNKIAEICLGCWEITDVRGWNVLHYAVVGKSENTVEQILSKPLLMYLLNDRDIKGYTPLELLLASIHSDSFSEWVDQKPHVVQEEFHKIAFPVDKDWKEKILEWMKDLGGGPLGETFELQKVTKHREESQTEREARVLPVMEKAKDSHLVAAALVATVTFAAAFTLPGGLLDEDRNQIEEKND